MDTGRSNFSVQGRDIAAPFIGDTPVYPRTNNYSATKPIVEERMELPTSSITNTAGSFSYFEIGRPMDCSREWYIQYDRAAGTNTSGDTPYFEDWEVYSSIQDYRIIYNNKIVWSRKGEQLIEDMKNGWYLESDKELTGWAALQNGMLTVKERQARFLQAQTGLKAPMQLPWRHIHKSLPHLALPNKIRVEIWWNTDNQCVHQPATSGVVVGAKTNLKLVQDTYHLLENERGKLYYQIYDGTLPYQIKTIDHEYEWRYGWTATTGTANADATVTLTIRNLRNNAVAIRAKLQYQDHVDVAQALDRQKEIPIRDIVFNNQGKPVTVSASARGGSSQQNSQSLLLHRDNLKRFPKAAPGSLLYYVAFCPDEYVTASEHNCFGSRTISKYANPDCKITYNASFNSVMPFADMAAAQSPAYSVSLTRMYLTLTSYVHQIIYMGQSDFRRYFLV